MSETQLVRACIDAISATGLAFVWRNQSGRVQVRGAWMSLAPEGSPDIVGFLRDGSGRFVGIEVKTNEGRVSKAQVEWAAELKRGRVLYGVARTVEEAIAIVREQ